MILAQEEEKIEKPENIKKVIGFVSGKGGTGKTFVCSNVALLLAKIGYKVGVLDCDIHGPNIPTIFGVKEGDIYVENERFIPIIGPLNIKIISVKFLLGKKDSPVLLRGPMKSKLILDLLTKTEWGKLDFLLIDFPPGTGDELMTLSRFLDGVVGIYIPNELAIEDCIRVLKACEKLKVKIIGLVENMSYVKCPKCGYEINIFGKKEIKGYELLGRVPIIPEFNESIGSSKPFIFSEKGKDLLEIFKKIVTKILEKV